MIETTYNTYEDQTMVIIDGVGIGYVPIGVANRIQNKANSYEDRLKYARNCYQRRLCLDMGVSRKDYKRLIESYDKKMAVMG